MSDPATKKFSFLDVFEEDPFHRLFLGDAAGIEPRRWAPNLETDRVKRKRAQGPTPNQEIGGRCVDWMHAHLTQRGDEAAPDAAFLSLLKKSTTPLMDGEPLSSTYYRYYCAAAAAAVRWGPVWQQPAIAAAGTKLLDEYLALLELHRTPAGIAMPGARCPRGAALPELVDFHELLSTGRSRRLARKKLRRSYEVAAWAVRELRRRSPAGAPGRLDGIRLRWPLHFERRKDGWLSFMPDLRSYDPCWAVSYVGGTLHELRWIAPDGRRKAEAPRKTRLEVERGEGQLAATLPGSPWTQAIPVPQGELLEELVIGARGAGPQSRSSSFL